MTRRPTELTPLTLTHARVRVAQGDHAGARAILRSLLDRDADSAEARRLLAAIAGRSGGDRRVDEQRAAADPAPAKAGDLAARFASALNPAGARRRSIGRLRALLASAERARDADG